MIKLVKCSEQVNNLITILYQNTTDDKVLGGLDLSKVSYHKNAAPVILALLTAAGLACDANGKELWRLADPATKLYWQQPKAANTRQPAERAAAALHGLGDAPLEHDEEAAVKGPAARLRAAEKTRPSALRVLASAPPPAKSAIIKQGTGWGSMPRPITSRCVADQVRRRTPPPPPVLELQVVYRHGTLTVPMRMVSGLDDAVDWWCQSCAYAERLRSFAHEPAMYVVYLGAQRGCPRVGSVAMGINIT